MASTTDIEGKISHLRKLPAIRERCNRVFAKAKEHQLGYFVYHPEKEAAVVDFCAGIITRDFGSDYQSIPPHGRWRHFDVGGRSRVTELISQWSKEPSPPNQSEITKRLLDLFLVSVLLDAGAGNAWKYTEVGTDAVFSRSEGLAIASLDMFKRGLFSGKEGEPFRVDAVGLGRLTASAIASSFQVQESNPMDGVEGRAALLINLGKALAASPEYFGHDARPGNMIDHLAKNGTSDGQVTQVPASELWHILMEGLTPIWPSSRTSLGGVALGDVWPCSVLGSAADASDDSNLVPFHKLSQWLAYSLVEPMERILNWKILGLEDMTGLPEYRNGGLFVDLGVLSLREDLDLGPFLPTGSQIPRFPPSHPAIIEWRALTVILLDRTADGLRTKLGASLTLPQVLESATWKGGREIAKIKRPETAGPPIEIESDGTVF